MKSRLLSLVSPASFLTAYVEDAVERRRTEYALAVARVLLAFSALVAIYIDPTEPTQYERLAYALISGFVVYAFCILFYVRRTEHIGRHFTVFVHFTSIVWAAVISVLTSGPSSAFFVFFVFVIVAAAFRWRLRECLLTSFALVVLLLVQGVTSAYQLFGTDLDLNRLIMRSAYLVIMGAFVGYLGEQDKLTKSEIAILAELVREIKTEGSFQPALERVAQRLLALFDAEALTVVTEDMENGRFFRYTALADIVADDDTAWSEIPRDEGDAFLSPLPGSVLSVDVRGHISAVIDELGHETLPIRAALNAEWLKICRHSMLAGDMIAGEEWRLRVFVVDPRRELPGPTVSRFLHKALTQLTPVLYSVYLIHRLRSQASAKERLRISREIHDGPLQSLSALELQLSSLAGDPRCAPEIAAEIARLRAQSKQETLALRDLMNEIRPVQLSPRQLPAALRDVVERFRRETGIAVAFVCDAEAIRLPAKSCRELVCIAQEALVNVRKHSHASNVLVALRDDENYVRLRIADDGVGPGFVGEKQLGELDHEWRGATVLRERVHAISAGLSIRSLPERGTEIRISVPTLPRATAEAAVAGLGAR